MTCMFYNNNESLGGFVINLTNDRWLQVHEHSPGDMFACSGLTKEGVVGVVSPSDGFVAWHLTVRLDAMLQAVQLPAGVTYLGSSLADVDRDTFTLQGGIDAIT